MTDSSVPDTQEAEAKSNPAERAAVLAASGLVAANVLRPILQDIPEAASCYDCNACNRTRDHCPVGIERQSELAAAARSFAYGKFVRNAGLKCIRCGACAGFCPIELDTAKMFGAMQMAVLNTMRAGRLPRELLVDALRRGQVNSALIDEVSKYCGVR